MNYEFSSRAIYARDGSLFSVEACRADPGPDVAESIKGWIDVFDINRHELILEGWATGGGPVPVPALSPPWKLDGCRFIHGLERQDVTERLSDHQPQASGSGFVLRVAVPRFFIGFDLSLQFPENLGTLRFHPKPRVRRRLWRQLFVNWAYHYPGWVKPLKRRLLGGRLGGASAREAFVAHVPKHLVVPSLTLEASTNGSSARNGSSLQAAVIIPVYNGLPLLERLFPRLVADPEISDLVVIDDCSPDPEVREFLAAIAGECPKVKLVRNPSNIGFVRSVNWGLELTSGDRIILNSDVDVPRGWVGRLLAPIRSDKRVASVTPFTNSGTILSFPAFNRDNRDFEELRVDGIDAAFQSLSLSPDAIELPTGVGFCMALSGRALEKIGFFDEKHFGRGYGEENDWCLRAAKAGFIHVPAVNLFVWHDHGGSFSEAEKRALLRRNLRRLEELHPGYDAQIQSFIRRDPLQPYRGLALLELCRGVFWKTMRLVIDHDEGGGANVYRQRELLRSSVETGDLLLVWDARANCFALSFRHEDLREVLRFRTLEEFLAFVGRLPLDEIVINSLVFMPAPLSILEQLGAFLAARKGRIRTTFVLHDFHPICPSHNLIDLRDRFCNLMTSDGCSVCLRRNQNVMVPAQVADRETWRKGWSRFLRNVELVRAFSKSSADLFLRVYPECSKKVVVRGHNVPVLESSPSIRRLGGNQKLVVGAVGNLNVAKGALVINRLVEETDLEIVVLGRINPEPRARTGLTLHGPYDRDELGMLMDRYGITLGFVPSVWPETYNFVVDELLQTGLPVAYFDIGAPPERGRGEPRVHILSYALKDDSRALATELRRIFRESASAAVFAG